MTIKPVTLRALWRGERPLPGHYVKATRGRVAYQIIDVAVARGLPALGRRWLRLRCWRVPPSEVPDGSIVHHWRWHRR